MALDFSCIANVDFYSGHYLDAVLEGDLKQVFDRWSLEEKEEGKRTPVKELGALATRFLEARSSIENETKPEPRWRSAREFHVYLLQALGYPYIPEIEPLDEGEFCPVLLSAKRDGNPFLWVVDAPFPAEDDDDPLDVAPLKAQLPESESDARIPTETWRALFDERIFRMNGGPRWVLFLAGDTAWLLERSKWPQGRYLRFDLNDLMTRKQTKALQAVAGLLHREVLAPEAGLCLHDTLDENSHKHAYSVSSDLKHGVRRAVELLANEAVWYRREVQKQGVFNDEAFAANLTSDCLTWMYRLLFLFYVEARGGELGVVPMNADTYREGYSLEKLRELELVRLESEQARNTYFIHDSLKTLFDIVNAGYPLQAQLREQPSLRMDSEGYHYNEMAVDAVNSPLFDDERMEVLRNVRFRNFVLQEVIQLLSLSAEKKRKTRGRISYAQLGINQLGAVYEGLLSYTGFFANEDLYEVAAEKDCKALSGKPAAEREALKTYFVPASKIGDYKEGEIVKDENERKVVHPRGDYIFRMAGRNREKSASYYTPEVLTRCLVKYALKELLWEDGEEGAKPTRKKTADEILALTICEPAMGSSAFLIEAVDQLADAYLAVRQEEKGEAIAPEKYQYEKRRVMARLATNNCYGVDLNPTAVELAKVSLWLATLHEDGKCPWFGLRLATGNSLVGARREVFKTADVIRPNKKDNPNWLGLVPESVPLHHGEDTPPPDEVDWANWTAPPRPKGTIYHFLLPAEGMAAFDKDKVIKQLAPESVKRIKEWRKEFCKPFKKSEAERLEQISDAVDRLFAQVVRERVLATQETSDRIPVWGEADYEERSTQQADLLVRDQEEVAASLEDGSSAYRRLKLAMDAWCALWFWPIEEAELLPDRATWLAQMELILKGQVTHEEVWQQQTLFVDLTPAAQGELPTGQAVADDLQMPRDVSAERLKQLQSLSNAFRDRRADYFDECGLADIDAVLEGDASLRSAQSVADRLRFQHWSLRFAEIFARQAGFNLVLGNPPWIKLTWNESSVLSDHDASLDIRKLRATDAARRRSAVLSDAHALATYESEFEELQGVQNYLSSQLNFPHLAGIQPNLYKCFLAKSWEIGSHAGAVGLLHPEGIYDDPKGGTLRSEVYPRLAAHFQFRNVFSLFELNDHGVARYGINVYRQRPGPPNFETCANLFHPRTIDECFEHDGMGSTPGIKTQEGDWDVRGHRSRKISIDIERLGAFARLYCEPGTPALAAPLPALHSEEALRVLGRLADYPKKLTDLSGDFFGTRMFDETYAQRDGTIRRDSKFASSLSEWIVQGPHFYVGTPLNKTPNQDCSTRGDYTAIDLAAIAEDYLPRTNYLAACSPSEYARRIPAWDGRSVTGYYRHINRTAVVPTNERTLITAIIPPGVSHISIAHSVAFRDEEMLLSFSAMTASLPVDFMVKCSGRGAVYAGFLNVFPVLEKCELSHAVYNRVLRLNCVTRSYSELWSRHYKDIGPLDSFTSVDSRHASLAVVSPIWRRDCGLRSDLDRRQALLELDSLISMALGLELAELLTIYRVQFPVLQQYDRLLVYDQLGRVVPTSKIASGFPAVSLVELAATLKEQTGFDVHAEYHPDGSNTQELLKRTGIRLGKKEADVLGVSERCTMADLLAETEVRWSDEDHPEGRPVRLVGLRYTDPGLEPRMERVYPTPWTRCDREADYRQAWAEFERRLGKKMPEGTPP